jgi:hypothetical protein
MAGLRMTVGVLAVLGALLDGPNTELYGFEIMRASGLEPGTIYRARAVHALQHGRDRSGLSRLLAPPASLPHPTTEAGPG